MGELPFAIDGIPRQSSFAGLSLKFGCIISALIVILYSLLLLAQCLAAFNMLPDDPTPDDTGVTVVFGVLLVVTIVHAVTFVLSALMLVGALREKSNLIKPWVVWTTLHVMVSVLLFVFWSTLNIINHSGGNSLLLYIIDFLGIMIRFYMLMVVASYYKQLTEERDENERIKKLLNTETWYNAA
ncbi:uncharacterized protein [Epargyreus clarus]|uniref:uncharacterized protein isoform X2 n=1 Tax=Epargyreus clarus TaxID=520877 RepID=UPI003C2B27FD